MSLLLKAFPHGRPLPHARTDQGNNRSVLATVLVSVIALLVVLLPLAGPAEAKRPKPHKQRDHATHRVHKTVHKKVAHKKVVHKKVVHKKVHRVVGQPPRRFLVPPTSYFSFPNRSRAEGLAIRKRVLLSIQSTWGGRRTRAGTPLKTNGTIRIATWSFDDWEIAKALVAARKRGVSVQVVAAKAANGADHAAWHWLRARLGQRLFAPHRKTTRDVVSFARECKGACRGPGGTPHSKYFLFDNVGPQHARKVTFQTSSNLTYMAYQGQWNQAQVMYSPAVYDDYLAIFRQTRIGKSLANPYVVRAHGPVVDYFFPRPQATAAQDPVMHILNNVTCRGATSGTAAGRTKIRVLQYAIYGDRGVWIAKKLRLLWKAGCDIAIIYSVSSRPVLSILRHDAGRGPIPMKQSVVKDSWGNIVEYNHSKWMTVTGRWGGSTGAYELFSGSANWANLAFGDDEQMQRISNRHEALRHNATFAKTWGQGSSSPPSAARVVAFGRAIGPVLYGRDVPAVEPAFGTGVFRYMDRD
jgi:hypothetical protein